MFVVPVVPMYSCTGNLARPVACITRLHTDRGVSARGAQWRSGAQREPGRTLPGVASRAPFPRSAVFASSQSKGETTWSVVSPISIRASGLNRGRALRLSLRSPRLPRPRIPHRRFWRSSSSRLPRWGSWGFSRNGARHPPRHAGEVVRAGSRLQARVLLLAFRTHLCDGRRLRPAQPPCASRYARTLRPRFFTIAAGWSAHACCYFDSGHCWRVCRTRRICTASAVRRYTIR